MFILNRNYNLKKQCVIVIYLVIQINYFLNAAPPVPKDNYIEFTKSLNVIDSSHQQSPKNVSNTFQNASRIHEETIIKTTDSNVINSMPIKNQTTLFTIRKTETTEILNAQANENNSINETLSNSQPPIDFKSTSSEGLTLELPSNLLNKITLILKESNDIISNKSSIVKKRNNDYNSTASSEQLEITTLTSISGSYVTEVAQTTNSRINNNQKNILSSRMDTNPIQLDDQESNESVTLQNSNISMNVAVAEPTKMEQMLNDENPLEDKSAPISPTISTTGNFSITSDVVDPVIMTNRFLNEGIKIMKNNDDELSVELTTIILPEEGLLKLNKIDDTKLLEIKNLENEFTTRLEEKFVPVNLNVSKLKFANDERRASQIVASTDYASILSNDSSQPVIQNEMQKSNDLNLIVTEITVPLDMTTNRQDVLERQETLVETASENINTNSPHQNPTTVISEITLPNQNSADLLVNNNISTNELLTFLNETDLQQNQDLTYSNTAEVQQQQISNVTDIQTTTTPLSRAVNIPNMTASPPSINLKFPTTESSTNRINFMNISRVKGLSVVDEVASKPFVLNSNLAPGIAETAESIDSRSSFITEIPTSFLNNENTVEVQQHHDTYVVTTQPPSQARADIISNTEIPATLPIEDSNLFIKMVSTNENFDLQTTTPLVQITRFSSADDASVLTQQNPIILKSSHSSDPQITSNLPSENSKLSIKNSSKIEIVNKLPVQNHLNSLYSHGSSSTEIATTLPMEDFNLFVNNASSNDMLDASATLETLVETVNEQNKTLPHQNPDALAKDFSVPNKNSVNVLVNNNISKKELSNSLNESELKLNPDLTITTVRQTQTLLSQTEPEITLNTPITDKFKMINNTVSTGDAFKYINTIESRQQHIPNMADIQTTAKSLSQAVNIPYVATTQNPSQARADIISNTEMAASLPSQDSHLFTKTVTTNENLDLQITTPLVQITRFSSADAPNVLFTQQNPILSYRKSSYSSDPQTTSKLSSENSILFINNSSKYEILNDTNINQSLQMEDAYVGLTPQQAITSVVQITNIPTEIVKKLPVQNHSISLNSLASEITTSLPMEDFNLFNKLTASTIALPQHQNIADLQSTIPLTHSTNIPNSEITTSLPSENSNFLISSKNEISQIDDSVAQPIPPTLTKDNENILQYQDLVLLNLPELLTPEISTTERPTIILSNGKLNVENQEQFSLNSRGTEIDMKEVQQIHETILTTALQSMKPLDAIASVSNENSNLLLNQDVLASDTLPIGITTSSPIHQDTIKVQNEILSLFYTTENSNIVTIPSAPPVDISTNLQNMNQHYLKDVQPFSLDTGRLSLPSNIISNVTHNVNDLTFPKREETTTKLPNIYTPTTKVAATTTMAQSILENTISSLIPQQKNIDQHQNLNVQSQAVVVATTEQPKIQLTDRILYPAIEHNISKDSSVFNVVAIANGQFIIPNNQSTHQLNNTQSATIKLSHLNTNINNIPSPASSINDVFNKLSVTNENNQQQTYNNKENKDNKNNTELILSNDYLSSQQQPLNQFFLEQTLSNLSETRNAETTSDGKNDSNQSSITTINPFTNGQKKEEIPIKNNLSQTLTKKPSLTKQFKNYKNNNVNNVDLKEFPHFQQIFNDMEANDSPPNIHIDLIPCMNTFMDGHIGERISFIDNVHRNSHSNNNDNNNRNVQPSKELVEVMNYPKQTNYKQNINTFETSPQQYNPTSLRYHHPTYNNAPNYGYPPPYIGYQSINPIQYNYQNNWNPSGRQSRGTTLRYNKLNEYPNFPFLVGRLPTATHHLNYKERYHSTL